MITKLQNPVVAAALGFGLSLALGIASAYRVLGVLIAQAAVPAVKQLDPEVKSRGWDFWTIEIENLSNELKEEKARLRKQSEMIELRAGRLAAEEKELGKLRADIEAVRKDIADKIITISADEAVNLKKLAQTYATLSPRAVVAIIREMDDATVIKIFSLLKIDVVGPVFEEMAKTAGPEGPLAKRAATLSEKLRLMKANRAGNGP